MAPAALFQFGPVTNVPKQFAQFEGLHMESADWEEHPSCEGPKGALHRVNAVATNPHSYVWRIPATDATETLSLDGATFALLLRHWPEEQNKAHAHLIMADGFRDVGPSLAKMRRKFVRTHLQKRSVLA